MGTVERQAPALRYQRDHSIPRLHTNSAFTLIELVLVAAVAGLVAVLILPLEGRYLDSAKRHAARSELNALGHAVLRYYTDIEDFPSQLEDLKVSPGVAGWKGPYLDWDFTDNRSGSRSFVSDGWDNRYILEVISTTEARVRSRGKNGIDENGDVDDIQYDVDVSTALRSITVGELRDLNNAVDAYNARFLPDEPLPTFYPDTLAELQYEGYLPSDAESTERYSWDGWGQPYETYGTLVLEVISAGVE